MNLVRKIVHVHAALERASIPHAFGGALALAWCTARARATIDIDVNIFVDKSRLVEALRALPKRIECNVRQRAALERDGQARLWWDQTPVDVFLNTTPFHHEVESRVRWEEFGDAEVPFLACHDIAVFKAFFNRTKDWADLEEMQDAGTLDVNRVTATLIEYLGPDDERIRKLLALRERGRA